MLDNSEKKVWAAVERYGLKWTPELEALFAGCVDASNPNPVELANDIVSQGVRTILRSQMPRRQSITRLFGEERRRPDENDVHSALNWFGGSFAPERGESAGLSQAELAERCGVVNFLTTSSASRPIQILE